MHGFAMDTMNDVHYEILLRENEKKGLTWNLEKGETYQFQVRFKGHCMKSDCR